MGSRQLLDAIRLVGVTDAQRNALAGTGDGDLVYNSERQQMQQRASGLWVPSEVVRSFGNLLRDSSMGGVGTNGVVSAAWSTAALSPILNAGATVAAATTVDLLPVEWVARITPHVTTNNTGFLQQVTGLPGARKYVFSVWLKGNTYNSTVLIALRDTTNAIETDSAAITLTSTWTRYAVVVSAGSGPVTLAAAVESFSHGTGNFDAAMPMLELGDTPMAWTAHPDDGIVFVDATARDTWITAPKLGQRSFLTTTGEELYYQGSTVGWRPPWNAPWGVVGTPVTSTTFSQAVTSAALVDLTGLTLAFTAVANRRYRATASGLTVTQTVANGTTKAYITDSANAILGLLCDLSLSATAPGIRGQVTGEWLGIGLAAGSFTVKVRAQASAGTSTFTNDAGAQVVLEVEDIGPNGNPS